jgi:hypothetical protein
VLVLNTVRLVVVVDILGGLLTLPAEVNAAATQTGALLKMALPLKVTEPEPPLVAIPVILPVTMCTFEMAVPLLS